MRLQWSAGPSFVQCDRDGDQSGPADYGNLAIDVCATLLTPQNTATALDHGVAKK